MIAHDKRRKNNIKEFKVAKVEVWKRTRNDINPADIISTTDVLNPGNYYFFEHKIL